MLRNYLTLIVLIPMVVTILNIIFPKILKKIFTLLGSFATLYFSIKIFSAQNLNFSLLGNEILQVDTLSKFILLFINILSFIILIYSLKNVKPDFESKFFLLFPITIAFCNGVAVSANTLTFIIFWGLSGLAIYLFGLLKGKPAAESSRKAFIVIGASDVLLIVGLLLLATSTNIFSGNIFAINVSLVGNGIISYIAFFCLLLAAFAKAGAFPMHTWVPDFAKDAPIESVAFLPAALDKLLGIYLLARIMMNFFKIPFFVNGIVMALGAITIIVAVMMALVQHDLRRLLGYLTVSSAGYMVLGLATGNSVGIAGGLFYMLNSAICMSCLFMAYGNVEKRTGIADLDKLGGLARRMPLTFIAALIGALSISGIPPFNGFFSKWMVYQGVLQTASEQNHIWQIVINTCLLLAVFGSALTLASFMKFIHSIFLGKLPKKLENTKEITFNNWFATMLLSLLCVIFGLFAFAIPVKMFILPILGPTTTLSNILLGFYSSTTIIFLFIVSIILGLIVYLIFKKIRFDDEYVGAKPTTEANRITGVDFYNDIKEMRPFKQIYALAEKKYFDIYNLGAKFSLWFGDIFHRLHTGLLHTYAIWTLAGLVIITLILISAL